MFFSKLESESEKYGLTIETKAHEISSIVSDIATSLEDYINKTESISLPLYHSKPFVKLWPFYFLLKSSKIIEKIEWDVHYMSKVEKSTVSLGFFDIYRIDTEKYHIFFAMGNHEKDFYVVPSLWCSGYGLHYFKAYSKGSLEELTPWLGVKTYPTKDLDHFDYIYEKFGPMCSDLYKYSSAKIFANRNKVFLPEKIRKDILIKDGSLFKIKYLLQTSVAKVKRLEEIKKVCKDITI